jgi:hypothetical protein
MRHLRRRLALLAVVSTLGLICSAGPARAEPTADQVLADMGLSAADKARVLSGEYVNADADAVSERDLSFSIAFLVKTSPDALARQIVGGKLITADSQVQAFGEWRNPGTLADVAALKITSDVAKALASARAGDGLNLSASEITAFQGAPRDTPGAIQQQLHRMLLARYQAYRASGLDGIAPYDRGDGKTTDLAADLRKASQAARGLQKYLPAFHAVLLGYPKVSVAGMSENFYWVRYNIQGKETYVLTHILVASDGAARAVVQRQYYVSAGYNGEQAVVGFLPVQGGTVAVYAGHAFTDQVAGAGGSMKRGIGRRVMASQMKKMFEAGRARVGQ